MRTSISEGQKDKHLTGLTFVIFVLKYDPFVSVNFENNETK